jgi:hypothetical protein
MFQLQITQSSSKRLSYLAQYETSDDVSNEGPLDVRRARQDVLWKLALAKLHSTCTTAI